MKKYFATCPKGLEYLLRDELLALGALEVHEALAGVYFSGAMAIAYCACLWSRLASRILLPLAEFEAAEDEALYNGIYDIDWAHHLSTHSTLAVEAVTTQSQLVHSQYIAQRVKDAIVDQFRRLEGARPQVDTETPDVRIHLRLYRNRATVSIDLSGTSLHRRGWRKIQHEAPLKENLAAAMLIRGRWPAIYAQGGALLDPMCGSGTLLIEGAWMAADIAPGLYRHYFGFLGWRQHDGVLWQALLDEAKHRAEVGVRQLRTCFFGSDLDARAIQMAIAHAQSAGVEDFINLNKSDMADIKPPLNFATGLVITNPPYGLRLGESRLMPALYHTLGKMLRKYFVDWSAAVLTGDTQLGQALRLQADKRYIFYNGSLPTTLLLFKLDGREEAPRPSKPLSAGAEMLKNRLEKNVKHLRKRLVREAIYCWRAYDQDLPEYAAAIDIYSRSGGTLWLHIQEYRAPSSIAAELARLRLHELIRVAGEVLDVPREQIILKTRQRGKGGAKYGSFDQRGMFLEVEEGGLTFLVNLTDYLDTGLFIDHRLVRMKLRQLAAGRSFLNLFAYTATASVYAAAGGALDTTSVDLSRTYLEWASRNLVQNGFTGTAHRLVQGDALEFLQNKQDRRYGLIYVDPPTFSNSKRAEDFDVQRDHVRLLVACGKHLDDQGIILFSNNFRRFQFDQEELANYFEVEDWSSSSIPFDFRRRDIHRCWLLRKKA